MLLLCGESGWRSRDLSRLASRKTLFIESQLISTGLRGFTLGTPDSSLVKTDSGQYLEGHKFIGRWWLLCATLTKQSLYSILLYETNLLVYEIGSSCPWAKWWTWFYRDYHNTTHEQIYQNGRVTHGVLYQNPPLTSRHR